MKRQPTVLFTPIQWIVSALVVLIGAGLVVGVFFRAPRADRVWDWSYPGAPWASGIFGVPFGQGGLMYADAPLARVAKWYADRLKVGLAPMMSSQTTSGIFSRDTINTSTYAEGPDQGFPCHVFVQSKKGQLLTIVVSRPTGVTNTLVYLAQVNPPSWTGTRPPGDFKFLAPSNSLNPGFATAGNMRISYSTITSSWDRVLEYYSDRAITPTNSVARVRLNVPGTLSKLEPPQASRWPGAPPMGGFPTNEAVFLYVDPQRCSALIRIHPTTNGHTHLVIGGAWF